jgi:hypothetical protein
MHPDAPTRGVSSPHSNSIPDIKAKYMIFTTNYLSVLIFSFYTIGKCRYMYMYRDLFNKVISTYSNILCDKNAYEESIKEIHYNK